jgi:ribosomal protein S18 acetylase RimI-like enzyme
VVIRHRGTGLIRVIVILAVDNDASPERLSEWFEPHPLTANPMPHSDNTILVRRATPADVPQLCELLTLLFAQEADFIPDTERQTRALSLIIEQPDVGHIYCATDGKLIAGMVSILFTISTAEGGRAAWLEDMVVNPGYRGSGIGKRLLDEAICQARSAGCSRITLLTDATNTLAMQFYGRSGFVRSQMVPFRLGL